MTLVIASRHGYTWEELCTCIGVGSIASPTGSHLPLCTQHYQLVYCMNNVRESEGIACQQCGVKRKHEKGAARTFLSCPEPTKLESFLKDTQLVLVTVEMVIRYVMHAIGLSPVY